jgi:hypothetical protein
MSSRQERNARPRDLLVVLGIALASLASTPVAAQSLADRIATTRDGAVTFQFAARPGVCGDGQHYIRVGRSYHGSFSTNMTKAECIDGPVQVRVTLADGVAQRVDSWVGMPRSRDARDLGTVPAAEGARYLMQLAARASGGASAKAIFPAVLADSATVWPALITIARDSATRSHSTRQDALFWLSRFAAGAVSGHPNDPFDDDSDADKDDLKTHAVFVLSQLPHKEGVPTLLDIARKNPDPHVRSSALFWLGQSGDPRALALFESLLR